MAIELEAVIRQTVLLGLTAVLALAMARQKGMASPRTSGSARSLL